MKKIKEGSNVKLIHNCELINGVVRTMFDGLKTVIVETENEELIKTTIDSLIVDELPIEKQSESKNELEKQISYEQFKSAIVDQVSPFSLIIEHNIPLDECHLHAQIALMLGAKLAADLFESMESTITITKSNLVEKVESLITLDLFENEALTKEFSTKAHLTFSSIILKTIDNLFEND